MSRLRVPMTPDEVEAYMQERAAKDPTLQMVRALLLVHVPVGPFHELITEGLRMAYQAGMTAGVKAVAEMLEQPAAERGLLDEPIQ